ncbi:class I SAM-dependent methyltransferase [Flagellimonas sp. HMM57]|nr:class I SAM-dependent methyltransferase [Flagellimonas sp. HMM57]UII77995.1 class I SAM-dependent methyltransferase [Flagellimonas sp. HMM57]
MDNEQTYWTQRYKQERTGWDIGYPSTPLKTYIDQLTDKNIKILIPGAGNAYEAEYLWKKGFHNLYVMDISPIPLNAFQARNPEFPTTHLLQENFFEHQGQYDIIFEQTFFCSLVPTDKNRFAYAEQMACLLQTNGKLVGVWFDIPLMDDMDKRPFGGDKELYLKYLTRYLKMIAFERCYNSIPPRQGNELFGIFGKKE